MGGSKEPGLEGGRPQRKVAGLAGTGSGRKWERVVMGVGGINVGRLREQETAVAGVSETRWPQLR